MNSNQMISDERLEEIIYRAEMFGHGAGYTPNEIIPMARELLALRKAFSEHVAWMADDGNVYSPVDFEGNFTEMDVVAITGGFEKLYRKPTDSTT